MEDLGIDKVIPLHQLYWVRTETLVQEGMELEKELHHHLVDD